MKIETKDKRKWSKPKILFYKKRKLIRDGLHVGTGVADQHESATFAEYKYKLETSATRAQCRLSRRFPNSSNSDSSIDVKYNRVRPPITVRTRAPRDNKG